MNKAAFTVMFDPYHKWLGIPPKQRPPTYYQLLGIAPDEADREVIEEAAIRQTTHVRTYQTGPRAAECTALLNEIAQARATLLNRKKRQEYDAKLGTAPHPTPHRGEGEVPHPNPVSPRREAGTPHPSPAPPPAQGSKPVIPSVTPAIPESTARENASAQFWQDPWSWVFLGLILLGGFLGFLAARGGF
jgi:hypothetical protein